VHKAFFRGGEKIDVLQGLDVSVAKGEFLALMGPSGSGKSTLLNLIGGLDRPSSGSIVVGGENITQLSSGKLTAWRARHVGFVFQLYNLLPALTAERNVELPLLLTSLTRARRRQQVSTALSLVGLSDRSKHYPRSSVAAKSSASESRERSSPTRRCCCATSRRATSTARPETRSSTCWRRSTATRARP
jgi:putative ABC transport system ATP-binding protein